MIDVVPQERHRIVKGFLDIPFYSTIAPDASVLLLNFKERFQITLSVDLNSFCLKIVKKNLR